MYYYQFWNGKNLLVCDPKVIFCVTCEPVIEIYFLICFVHLPSHTRRTTQCYEQTFLQVIFRCTVMWRVFFTYAKHQFMALHKAANFSYQNALYITQINHIKLHDNRDVAGIQWGLNKCFIKRIRALLPSASRIPIPPTIMCWCCHNSCGADSTFTVAPRHASPLCMSCSSKFWRRVEVVFLQAARLMTVTELPACSFVEFEMHHDLAGFIQNCINWHLLERCTALHATQRP